MDEILNCERSNKSIEEHFFSVVVLIMLSKVIITFESVNEIGKCDYSNESYRTVFFGNGCAVFHAL